jgi:LPXTG-site transpeptidase (sortase) family protein
MGEARNTGNNPQEDTPAGNDQARNNPDGDSSEKKGRSVYKVLAIVGGYAILLVALLLVLRAITAKKRADEAALMNTPAPLVITTPVSTPTPSPTPTPLPTPSPTPFIQQIPTMISFDNHNLKSRLHAVGLAQDGTIGTVNSASDAAWFSEGASPGDPGNAILSGHVSWGGKAGTFAVLHYMQVGEQVSVEFESGAKRVFEVTNVDKYTIDDFPSMVTDFDGDERLTLITCLGDYDRAYGTSRTRVVVICKEKPELRQAPPGANESNGTAGSIAATPAANPATATPAANPATATPAASPTTATPAANPDAATIAA